MLERPVHLAQILRNKIPVDQIPKSFDVFGAGIAVIDVIGMLPNVTGQKRRFPLGQWVAGIGEVDNGKAAIAVFHKPSPARSEQRSSRLRKLLFELVKGTKGLVDCFQKGTSKNWSHRNRTGSLPLRCSAIRLLSRRFVL